MIEPSREARAASNAARNELSKMWLSGGRIFDAYAMGYDDATAKLRAENAELRKDIDYWKATSDSVIANLRAENERLKAGLLAYQDAEK